MKLIARRPCSFGGRKFFIGQEVPEGLVAEPGVQERLGVLAVIVDGEAGGTDGELFTKAQVDQMMAQMAEELQKAYEDRPQDYGEGIVAEGISDISVFDGKVIVPVVNKENGDTGERMAVPLTEGEVQQVFSIMQMSVPDAEKAISEVTEENILIVLHACDTRAKVRKAAKNRADTLIPVEAETDAPVGGNEAAGHIQEADNQSFE